MKIAKIWMLNMLVAGSVMAHSAAHNHTHEGEHPLDPSEVVISMYSDADGGMFSLAADPKAVLATPTWDGTGDPPVSIGTAFALAIAWLKENRPEFTEFHPERFSLQRIWHEGLEDRWAATVSVRATGKLGPVRVTHQFEVVVLMDETVVGPVEVTP